VNALRRTVSGAAVALVVALAAAAPAAAAQPTRTFVNFDSVQHIPAGRGCNDFDVTLYRTPGSGYVETDFSDGRIAYVVHMVDSTITNDSNGKVFQESSIFHEVDRYDAATDVIHGSVTGTSIFQFAVGDAAPDGSVVDHVYAIFIRGTVTYAIDGTTFATLAISVKGEYTDICAAIS